MININKGYHPYFLLYMKIYLTRHSKTVWNEERRLQGRRNSDLLDEGIENAKALRDYIINHDMHFDYIYSSPILRAYKTAQIIFNHNDIILDDRLMEMNFGNFEGKKITELLDEELYQNLWNHPEKFTKIPGGESYDDVMDRVQSFLEDLQDLKQDSSVFIVTHGMCFIVMLAVMMHLKKEEFVTINQHVVEGCSLTLVEFDEDYHFIYKNLCDYLPHKTKNISFKN